MEYAKKISVFIVLSSLVMTYIRYGINIILIITSILIFAPALISVLFLSWKFAGTPTAAKSDVTKYLLSILINIAERRQIPYLSEVYNDLMDIRSRYS